MADDRETAPESAVAWPPIAYRFLAPELGSSDIRVGLGILWRVIITQIIALALLLATLRRDEQTEPRQLRPALMTILCPTSAIKAMWSIMSKMFQRELSGWNADSYTRFRLADSIYSRATCHL
jgi:hypothetical protein